MKTSQGEEREPRLNTQNTRENDKIETGTISTNLKQRLENNESGYPAKRKLSPEQEKNHKNLKATNTEIETYNRWNILNEEEINTETENEKSPSSQIEDMSQNNIKEKNYPSS